MLSGSEAIKDSGKEESWTTTISTTIATILRTARTARTRTIRTTRRITRIRTIARTRTIRTTTTKLLAVGTPGGDLLGVPIYIFIKIMYT